MRADKRFATNNLNRDFVGTRGFSVVFHGAARARVEDEFPHFAPFLQLALRPDCNAFYLNPLELVQGSRVDPHIDRSLRAYCKTVSMPLAVSVLYAQVPQGLRGGALVLARGRKVLARVAPVEDLTVEFAGDLTHSIERMESPGARLSLVCEQYALEPAELLQVPEFAIESRARY
ncbi:MAG: 2OG-Fe(II) oxygenase [Planctomycetota bacterium]